MKAWQYVIIVFFVVVFLVVAGAVRWLRPYNLEREREAARAAGIPMSATEFPQVAPPADQNAVPIYLALRKALKGHELDGKTVARSGPNGSGPIPKAKTVALRALLESRPDVGLLVHAAIAKPHIFVNHKWGADETFPYLAPMRTAAKWTQWECILLARDGRYQEAVKHQAFGFHIARQASEDPNLIAYLVAIGCERLTLRGFEDILAEAGPNAAVAEAVRKEIAAYHPSYDLTRCLKGEAIGSLATLRELKTVKDFSDLSSGRDDNQGDRSESTRPLSRPFILEPMEAVYLHWITQVVTASKRPILERRTEMDRIQAEFDKAPHGRPAYIFAEIAIPASSHLGEGEVDMAARRAAVTAMADVMAYRARHGRWPAAITDAASPPPIDPNTGHPVEYRVEGAGFVITTQANTTGLEPAAAARKRRAAEIRYRG